MSCRECGSPTSCFAGCPNSPPDVEHDEGCLNRCKHGELPGECLYECVDCGSCDDECDCACHRTDEPWDTSDLGGPDEPKLGGRR